MTGSSSQTPCSICVSPFSAPLALTDVFHYLYISYLADLVKQKENRLAADDEYMRRNPNIKKMALRTPGTTYLCIDTSLPQQSIVTMYNIVHTF
jgi:hypothetical protein